MFESPTKQLQNQQFISASALFFHALDSWRRGTAFKHYAATLRTSLYFHDFSHVEMFGYASAAQVSYVPLNECDCDKLLC